MEVRLSKVRLVPIFFSAIILLLIIGIGFAVIYPEKIPEQLGVSPDPLSQNVSEVRIYQPAKTLWDWLQLLLVPSILALGGFWFTRSENRHQEKIEQQTGYLEEQRSQDAALQSYFDQMTELLLKGNLKLSSTTSEVRSIARSRTLATLRGLDGSRKKSLLLFLYETGLVFQGNKRVIDLSGADLQEIELENINLFGIDLTGANLNRGRLKGTILRDSRLSGATLIDANLESSRLHNAILTAANLTRANMYNTKLDGAVLRRTKLIYTRNLFDAQLQRASRLRGAILKDGQPYMGQFALKDDIEDAKKIGIDINDGSMMKNFYNEI